MKPSEITPGDVKLAPPMLLDMQEVWDLPQGRVGIVDPPALALARQLCKERPWEFLDRMAGLEKVFLQVKAKVSEEERVREERLKAEALAKVKEAEVLIARMTAPSEWKGEGPCPTCKREAPVEDLEQWKLEELIEGLSETK